MTRVRIHTLLLSCVAVAVLLALACVGGQNQDASVDPTPSSGCRLHNSPGDYAETMESGGITRAYLLHVPPRYDGSRPSALVLAFHGVELSAEFFSNYTALDERTDQRNWIVAFPQASGGQRAWNVFGDASQPDDRKFATELLDHLKQTLCVDQARIYATGFSLGGGMAQFLACLKPTDIAAIGVVASTFSACTAPVPLLVIQGTLDAVAPYLGGTYPPQIGGGPAPSIQDVFREWVSVAGCSQQARTEQFRPDVIVTRPERCTSQEIVLYVVQGGAHGWPGSPLPIAEAIGGKTTNSISASDLIVKFFENQKRSSG